MNNPINLTDLAVVLGGTGKTGRRVAELLTRKGVATRSVARSTPTPFDWNDPSTWRAALEGATVAYVAYSPDLAVPEAPPAIEELCRLANEVGIERLVLLSGRGEEEAQRCEQIVLRAVPRSTVVRASWFAQNFSESFFLEPLLSGCLALPAGEVQEPFVDADDIAEVAYTAMTEAGHEGRIHEVTGPRLMTFAEAVAEIAQAAGRPFQYQQISLEAFAEGLRSQQVPEDFVALTHYLFDTVLDGRNAELTDGVERVLGRPARDFAESAREAARSGVWGQPGESFGQPEPQALGVAS